MRSRAAAGASARAATAIAGALLALACAAGAADAPVPGQSQRAAPGGTAAGRGILNRAVPGIGAVQIQLARALVESTRALGLQPSASAFAAVLITGIASGVLVAAGPGHGKIVVALFFLARGASFGRAVLVASVASALQAAASMAAVWILGVALGEGRLGVLRGAAKLEVLSYALAAIVGLWVMVDASRHTGASRRADATPRADAPRRRKGDWALIAAAGLTPSAAAIALLFFALAGGVPGAGTVAALAMAAGAAITLSAVAAAGAAARRIILRAVARSAGLHAGVARALGVAGGLVIAVAGALFCWSAWSILR